MTEKDLVIRHYSVYEEEERLAARHGRVEYLTTMHYIHRFLKPGMRILEIGAGTGRYSLALAREGYRVDALELVEHNIEVFQSKLQEGDTVNLIQGNALDLSVYEDETFDITLSLGPMYHLFDDEKKKQAMREAIHVTKKGGYIFTAYCMNEATMLQYTFGKNLLSAYREKKLVSEDFVWTPNENDAFSLVRSEQILALTEGMQAERIGLIATDGATLYLEDMVDAMNEEMFAEYMKYHLSICERQDLIGASNHTLDILQRR
ncbi:MAG: class I SAM-dependent methyltransferase [Lachnospiraceae bacterium]|nr:class I SAM-dependent methyltransferase [Lachnospiraceae bacterium]